MPLPSATPATLEGLYRDHRPRVVRLCRLLLADPDEAADVAQDVFLRIDRVCREGRTPADWTAWIVRVTVNACHDRRRSGWWRWWRLGGATLDTHTLPSAARSPEDEAARREQHARVWSALRRLPARQREVFVLRHLEGLATDTVADMLGIAAGSVKRHLFRAVQTLRGALGEEA